MLFRPWQRRIGEIYKCSRLKAYRFPPSRVALILLALLLAGLDLDIIVVCVFERAWVEVWRVGLD
jgi:hypothetical protein